MEAPGGECNVLSPPPKRKKKQKKKKWGTLSCEIATGLGTSDQFVSKLKGDDRCYFTVYWTPDSRYRYRHG